VQLPAAELVHCLHPLVQALNKISKQTLKKQKTGNKNEKTKKQKNEKTNIIFL